jgi:chorismate--pyruvate lyase
VSALYRYPRHNVDPRWLPVTTVTARQLAPRDRYWLLDEGSLTRRLIDLGDGDFAVQRLTQGVGRPLPSERRLLGLPSGQRALIREVALVCRGAPVVFARSVVPLTSLAGPLRYLKNLGNQSLGALLFRNPGLTRTRFELAALDGQCAYIHPSLRSQGKAWARRSRLVIANRPMLVSEVFLPGFTPWPRRRAACKL